MNFTLHVTEKCNFGCTYCRHKTTDKDISLETVKALIAVSEKYGNKTGFCFYGGEPLCAWDRLKEIIEYCNLHSKANGTSFQFKMNSNGSLFSYDKLKFLTENNVEVCLSHDGLMQCITKPDLNGKNTFQLANESAELLLQFQPGAAVQMVFAPESCHLYADSVRFLYGLGFRRILAVYASGVTWQDKHLEILKQQYQKLAEFYKSAFLADDAFLLSYIDEKIQSGIFGKKSMPCHMGRGQYTVTADGGIYPCSQFAGKGEYLLGDAVSGLDAKKISRVMKLSTTPEVCDGCALSQRCRNTCGCINLSETGTLNGISPFHCNHERLVIDCADQLAEQLYSLQPERFKKKYAHMHL